MQFLTLLLSKRSVLFLTLLSILVFINFAKSDAVQGRHLKEQKPKPGKNKACKKSKKNNFCKGVSFPLAGGGCSDRINICDDMDETTADSCNKRTETCSHAMIDPSDPTCLQTCEPDCDDKQCGENGCGGFCGTCPEGSGCSNYTCTEGGLEGSCAAPYNLGNGGTETIISGDRMEIISTGDTGTSAHVLTPTCNYLTASPELIFKFIVPEGSSYGYDIRATGYDTVLDLMKDICGNDETGFLAASVSCNDDSTPPGNLGSRVSGTAGPGTYYLMIDGFSSVDFGPFEISSIFIKDCVPLCDGNFCGSDGCGGSCGSCDDGFECFTDNRCYEENCEPKCGLYDRSCGEDGCGGSCGTCDSDAGFFCLGESIFMDDGYNEDGTIPESSCVKFEACDHFNPVCTGCNDDEFCGSDCQCYSSVNDLPDMVIVEEHLLEETYIHDVDVPETSCSLIEGCVGAPGMRRLLRFTSSALNQGNADFMPPDPKTRPDIYEYGPCHQHFHFMDFAKYTLYDESGSNVVIEGQKYAYCMEDTVQSEVGANIGCEKKYDCGMQGIQKGWIDSYGWSLDCSWIDITGIPAGRYQLEIVVNPGRKFAEVSYNNNAMKVIVDVPDGLPFGSVDVPLKVQTSSVGKGKKSKKDSDSGDNVKTDKA